MKEEKDEKNIKEICEERARFAIDALAISIVALWISIDFAIGFNLIFNLIGLAILLIIIFFRPLHDLIELAFEVMEEEKDDYRL